MGEKKIYIIQDCGTNESIKVALTDEQLSAIENFTRWAEIGFDYDIREDRTQVEEW